VTDISQPTTATTKRTRRHIQLPADLNDESASLKRGGIELVAGLLGIGVSTALKYKAEGRLLPATPIGDRKSTWTYEQMRQMARDGIAPRARVA
jgi:hypothetical protein